MKSSILTITTFFLLNFCVAQEAKEPISQSKKNEFGLDVTPFVQTFLFFNSSDNAQPAQPDPYYVMYRRFFGPWALRAGVGGYKEKSTITQTIRVIETESKLFDARLGFEHTTDFGKRWQAFYGLDLFYSSSYEYTLGESDLYDETKSSSYGFSPVFGMRLKINERISITSETSYRFYSTEKSIYQTLSYPVDHKSQYTGSTFLPPTSLYFTLNF